MVGRAAMVEWTIEDLPRRVCLELGAGDLSERTQLEELEEDVHFVFR